MVSKVHVNRFKSADAKPGSRVFKVGSRLGEEPVAVIRSMGQLSAIYQPLSSCYGDPSVGISLWAERVYSGRVGTGGEPTKTRSKLMPSVEGEPEVQARSLRGAIPTIEKKNSPQSRGGFPTSEPKFDERPGRGRPPHCIRGYTKSDLHNEELRGTRERPESKRQRTTEGQVRP